MKICDKGHSEIVYRGKYNCPLCQLITHNNIVPDFIESKGTELVRELVKYQNDKKEDI